MVKLSVLFELGGDLVHGLRVGHALIVGLEVPCGHGDKVDDAPEVVLGAHRELCRDGLGTQAIFHGLNRMEEVGADAVVLVDEGDAGNAVALRLNTATVPSRTRRERSTSAVKSTWPGVSMIWKR